MRTNSNSAAMKYRKAERPSLEKRMERKQVAAYKRAKNAANFY